MLTINGPASKMRPRKGIRRFRLHRGRRRPTPFRPTHLENANMAIKIILTAAVFAVCTLATVTNAAASEPNLTSYVAMSQRDVQRTSDALTAMGTACSAPVDFAACRDSMVAAQKATRSYQDDLNANPTPDCLSAADSEIRDGLGGLNDGLNSGIAGIDALDPDRINQGALQMMLANDHLNTAASLIQQANC